MNPNAQTQPSMKVRMIGAIKMEPVLEGDLVLTNGKEVNADAAQTPISDELYYIVPDKCTECVGFHEEPQCAAVCPVDCCVPDDSHVETEEVLLGKQRFMHPE